MITLKSPHEIELMRRAGKITAAARALARDMVKPGAIRAMDSADGLRPLILSAIRDGEETKKVTERILC